MKCDAASMRRSASVQSLACALDVAGVGCDAGQRVEREHLDGSVVAPASVVEDGREASLGVGCAVGDVERGEEALAEGGLLAASHLAVPASLPPRGRSARPRPVRARAGRARGARGRARRGERRRWPRPSRARASRVAAPAW